jgi:hypothetical protein
MTKRQRRALQLRDQRERVVDLLRCAADVGGIATAFEHITGVDTFREEQVDYPVWEMAVRVRRATEMMLGFGELYATTCLEAAALLEDGWTLS